MSYSSQVPVGWQDYVGVAFRRKKLFFTPLIISSIIAVIVMIFSTRIYEAEALIMIRNEKLVNPLIQGLAIVTPIKDRLATLREEILSYSNLGRLITDHGLNADIAKNDPEAFEKLVRQLRQDITVKMRDNQLILVSYEGRDPARVQELVNALTDIVIARDSAIQKQEADTAVEFIETELNVYRAKLEESEKHLREFKELYVTQMPVAAELNKQVQELEVTLSNLMIDNTEDHPRVKEVKRQIGEAKRQRDEEVKRLVAKGVIKADSQEQLDAILKEAESPEAASENAKKVQQAIDAVVRGLESPEAVSAAGGMSITNEGGGGNKIQFNDATAAGLTLAPRQQQELTRLTRDYTVNEQIYRGLLEKLEKAKITGRLGQDDEGGKFTVIERARFPLKPIRPNLVQVLAVALTIGIAIGIALVVLMEYLDQTVQSADEMAELLAVPVLGSISTILTEADIEEQKRRRKEMWSYREHVARLRTQFWQPIWTWVDRVLVKWGL